MLIQYLYVLVTRFHSACQYSYVVMSFKITVALHFGNSGASEHVRTTLGFHQLNICSMCTVVSLLFGIHFKVTYHGQMWIAQR